MGLRTNDRPLLDLSQAAPSFPPADVVADRIAVAAHESDMGRYAPQPGVPALRDAFAADINGDYSSDLSADNVLITAGRNQAFCLVATALTEPGAAVILVAPFYFNHDMWLRIEGVDVVHLEPGADMQPDPGQAEALIGERTRAIVLVTPGNPSGVTVPPDTIHAFADLARRRGLTLIVDETYRSLRGSNGPAHRLFADPDWIDSVVSLHSFSKDFAIPGYRVGALLAGNALLIEALKVLDCVAISASRIGQEAALAGLLHASSWRKEQAARIANLEKLFLTVMSTQPGRFEVVTSGAYFGWVRHPFADRSTDDVVRQLVLDHDVLVIPGTAFTAADEQMLRMSFANLEPDEIDELPRRLAESSLH